MTSIKDIFFIIGLILSITIFSEASSNCYNNQQQNSNQGIQINLDSFYDRYLNKGQELEDSTIQTTITLYDAIFNPLALPGYAVQSCWLTYKKDNIEIISEKAEKIRHCLHVNAVELLKYFDKNNQKEFEKVLNKELTLCTLNDDVETINNCYVDAICNNLYNVKDTDKDVSSENKHCVASVLSEYIKDTNKSSKKLNKCLSKVDNP